MITNSGRHIQIVEKRFCSKCNVFTDQICHKIRYQDNEAQAGTLIKKSSWVCPTCLTDTEDAKVQLLPGDKVRIINRILKMQDDYAIQSMSISSLPEKLVVEMTIKESTIHPNGNLSPLKGDARTFPSAAALVA
jgi:hypothetical protein